MTPDREVRQRDLGGLGLGGADLRRLLLRFHLYTFGPAADFAGAARLYRGAGKPASHRAVASTA